MNEREELIELRKAIHDVLSEPLTATASTDVKSMQIALHLHGLGYRTAP